MDQILIYHFENVYWLRMCGVEIESKRRTLEGWDVTVSHQTEWGREDERVDVSLEEMFDAITHKMENEK